jgi:predicted flap endonuclease-1-like 5' DNA nuclease
MRWDYTLYVLAVIFFIITTVSFFLITEQNEGNIYIIPTVIFGLLGILFVIVGYCMKPNVKATAVKQTPPPVISEVASPASESEVSVAKQAASTPKATTLTATEPELELTQIRGINKARAEQLKANGITTYKALAQASADDLAAKLEVSPKIMKMWIGSAKKRVK